MRFAVLSFLFLCIGFVSAAPDLSVGDIINALGVGLVSHINVTITTASLTNNLVSINFDVKNPLPIELSLDRVQSSAGVNGEIFASFDHTFSKSIVVPPLSTRNSGNIDNVLLIQGIDASLAIVPLGELDLSNTNADVRAFTILGFGGVPIPLDGLKQADVPTAYNLQV